MSYRILTVKSFSSAFVAVIIFLLLPAQMEDLACDGLHLPVEASSKTTTATRRDWLSQSVTVTTTIIATSTCNNFGEWDRASSAFALGSSGQRWMPTNLPLLSLEQAVKQSHSTNLTWTMGRWPDPILRRPAESVDKKWFSSQTLQHAAKLLKCTADQNGAVGLAAQQCGVNARMVYLSPKTTISASTSQIGTILVNPYIVARSPEKDMRVWVEECLVLPSSFRATLLRDDWIDVQYNSIDGHQYLKRFRGEASRCLQHEMDHDRGILIIDHLMLDELPIVVNETKVPLNMREIETNGHQQRMSQAYNRFIDVPLDRPRQDTGN
jgi:peptide deformylase